MSNPWDDAPIVTPAQQQTTSNPWDNAPIVTPAEAKKTPIDPHSGEYGTLGNLGYGALKGLADSVQAPAQLAMHGIDYLNQMLPNGGSSSITNAKNKFDTYLKNQEELYQLDTPESASAGVGRLAASTLPFLTGNGSSIAQLPSKAVQLGAKLGQGGLITALSQPVTNGGDNFAMDKVAQGVVGAAGTGVGVGLGKLVGGLISPSISDAGRAALKEGITPTIGQLKGGILGSLENKATSIPYLGDAIKRAQASTTEDFNRAIYNRALKPIGMDASELPVGREGVLGVKAALSDAYEKVLPNLKFNGDAQFGTELNKIMGMVNNGSLPATESAQFNSILKNNVLNKLSPNGSSDGRTYQEIISDVGQKAKGFMSSQDPNQRNLGQALNEVTNSMRANLTRSNPEQAVTLNNINQGYANYAILRNAAKSIGAENGTVTPAMLNRAVQVSDKSVGKGNFATGNALMQDLADIGKNVAPTMPNSGTADRLATPAALVGIMSAPHIAIPSIVGTAAASLPYTATGKKIAASILARRPDYAPALSNSIQNPFAIGGALSGANLANALNSGK